MRKVYGEDFYNFCENHTIEDIISKYGKAAKTKVYREKIPHQYKEHSKKSQMTIDIVTDLKNGFTQCSVAKKYGVSRQYVSFLNKTEVINQ